MPTAFLRISPANPCGYNRCGHLSNHITQLILLIFSTPCGYLPHCSQDPLSSSHLLCCSWPLPASSVAPGFFWLIQLIPATDHTLKMDNRTGGQALLSSPIHPYPEFLHQILTPFCPISPSPFSFTKHEKYPHIPAFRR